MRLNTKKNQTLICEWVQCGGLRDEHFPSDAVDVLQKHEFTFVHPTTLELKSDPRRTSVTHDVKDPKSVVYRHMAGTVLHAKMPRQYYAPNPTEHSWGKLEQWRDPVHANATYYNRSVSLRVSLFAPDRDEFDLIADEHVAMVGPLIPKLQAAGGWIDIMGDNFPSHTEAKRCTPKKLTWVQYFGPAMVDAIGRDFLLAAPVWRVEDLGEAGVQLHATERLSDWLTESADELVTYFAARFPKIKQYRSKRSVC